MSTDSSLKIKGTLSRHRNVLTRAERIEKLKDEERWSESDSLLSLPKVAHRKGHTGRKSTKPKVTAEAAATEAETKTPEAKEKES